MTCCYMKVKHLYCVMTASSQIATLEQMLYYTQSLYTSLSWKQMQFLKWKLYNIYKKDYYEV